LPLTRQQRKAYVLMGYYSTKRENNNKKVASIFPFLCQSKK